jgi:hypothetical protein
MFHIIFITNTGGGVLSLDVKLWGCGQLTTYTHLVPKETLERYLQSYSSDF